MRKLCVPGASHRAAGAGQSHPFDMLLLSLLHEHIHTFVYQCWKKVLANYARRDQACDWREDRMNPAHQRYHFQNYRTDGCESLSHQRPLGPPLMPNPVWMRRSCVADILGCFTLFIYCLFSAEGDQSLILGEIGKDSVSMVLFLCLQ